MKPMLTKRMPRRRARLSYLVGHSSDSGDPDLDIDKAMQMTAKLLRFKKSAPSSKHPVEIHKPQSQRPADALTAAVGHVLELML